MFIDIPQLTAVMEEVICYLHIVLVVLPERLYRENSNVKHYTYCASITHGITMENMTIWIQGEGKNGM